MDQLNEQLAKVKPYAFWIACVIILLTSVGTWYMATGTLQQEREANKGQISSAESQLQGVSQKSKDHPNPEVSKGMDELIKAYGVEIAAGWEAQYLRQKDVLVWPKSFDEDFQNAVKDLRPIEKVPVVTPINLAIPDSFRRRYRDFIEDELPSLAKTIGGKWYARREGAEPEFPTPSGPQALGPDGRPLEVDTSTVLWSPENQSEILNVHFGFTAKANDPSTLDVLYAQEDLWVLQNLMEIIKKTNDGAEGRHNATVKRIEFIRIGRSALGNAGQVMIVSDAPAGSVAGGPGREGGYPSAQAQVGPSAPMEGQPPTGEQTAGTPVAPTNPASDPLFNVQDPGNWRYVDQANYPLAGFQLRAALTQSDSNAQNALLAVAKRMPVRLRLEVDQRYLNKLLAEFGNAALPVEVRQLRINREPAAPGDVAAFFAAAGQGVGPGAGPGAAIMPRGEGFSGGPGGSRGGYQGLGEGGFAQPGIPGGQGSLTKDATVDTNLIQLEVYGIVYIYNPVNRTLLGLEPSPSATAMAAPATP